jgi:Ser/Thr protein kinase RdoA (MazF antagonist)
VLCDRLYASYGLRGVRASGTGAVGERADGSTVYVKLYRDVEAGEADFALRVVRRLHVRALLPAAVPAVPAADGSLAIDVSDAHSEIRALAVFALLPGPTAAARPCDDDESAALADAVVALHSLPAAVVADVPLYEGYRYFFGERLVDALHRPGLPAVVEDARAALLEAHDRLARLAGCLKADTAAPVSLTHGDLHPGNILRDAQGGVRIIDWDYVAFGPPERDLASMAGHGLGPLVRAYRRRRPDVALSADRFRYYLDKWMLGEIADLLVQPADDARLAWLVGHAAAGAHPHLAEAAQALDDTADG